MNFTNADYFTFNIDNTMFLTGQTGSGKTEFARRLINNYENTYKPKDMQYAIFDLKMVEFAGDMHKPEYLYFDIVTDSVVGLNKLEELAADAQKRAALDKIHPLLFVYIEECDMSCLDQSRFDNAVTKINKYAKQANIKLIYSTSRVSPDTISMKLLKSFDLIAAGKLYEDAYSYLGLPIPKNQPPYSFMIVDNKNKQ